MLGLGHRTLAPFGDRASFLGRIRQVGGGFRVEDPLEDAARVDQHLDGRDPAEAVDPLEEPLGDDAPQRAGQRRSDLSLLPLGEQLDDAGDRLGDVDPRWNPRS